MNSALQEIKDPLFQEKGVQVWMKRDDLLHPLISGNKWRKLKYNLREAKEKNVQAVLSFGGAYSNHIHALAAAAKEYGLKSIGLIRGEELSINNNTLKDAADWGMEIHFIPREAYRTKEEEILQPYYKAYSHLMVIPEGGSNALAIKGVAEIIVELDLPFTTICTPSGTGATAAGLITGTPASSRVLAFSALKGDFLKKDIAALLPQPYSHWELNNDYTFGGYAKMDQSLFDFILSFQKQHNILLDPIYNSKMMYGIYDLVRKDYFKPGEVIVALHTGGLQGWREWGKRYPRFSLEQGLG